MLLEARSDDYSTILLLLTGIRVAAR